MSFYNLLRTAWYSLRAYKLRIFLTMIGIIIGISSVSAILAIGEGLKKEASASMESSNLNKVTINYSAGADQEEINAVPFKESDLQELEKLDGVKKVTKNDNQNDFFSFNYQEVSYFDRISSFEVKSYSKRDQKRELSFGRNMSKAEGESDKKLIVLGYGTALELFGEPEKALGKGIRLKDEMYEVIGVGKAVVETEMEFDLGGMDRIDPNSSLVPKNALVDEQSTAEIMNLSIYLEPGMDKNTVVSAAKDKLYELHPDMNGEYEEFDMQKIIESMQKVISNITLFVVFVTGISLLVGGIGVMNIMYVSVTERKREIGIRRAIGAKPKTILLQFLIEAIFITGLGGLIGIALGYGLSVLIGIFLPFSPVMTAKNFIGAASISVLTGLIFGIIPASKAAKLDPIKAIYK